MRLLRCSAYMYIICFFRQIHLYLCIVAGSKAMMTRLKNEFLEGCFTPAPFETVLSYRTNTEQPRRKKQKTRESKFLSEHTVCI